MASATYPGAMPPPAGVTADVDNPHDVLRTVMFVTQALTLLFVTVFVAMRVWAKARILRAPSTLDDIATYTSYVLMVGYCITSIFAAIHGGGLHLWDIKPAEAVHFFQSGYAATIFYAPMAMTVKLSLLLIIIRVFGSVHKKTLILIYILVAIIVGYYTTGFFIKIFICWPISSYWKGETDKCMDQSAIITADAIISVISDVAILLLPTPLTWSLQMPLKRRLRIIGMLAAGGIATAFSVYRLALIIVDGKSQDQSIVFAKVILSGNAEAGIGLICACLPAANAVLTKWKNPAYFLGSSRSRQDTTANRGEIVMTRSFHVDTSQRDAKDLEGHSDSYDLGQEEAGLTSSAQTNPRSNGSTHSPSRDEHY